MPIRKSVTPGYIVCLEDGKRFKSLKRHLGKFYGLTPKEYRAKWGLPADYPMVAPNYAASRSAMAKEMRLGQMRRAVTAAATTTAAKPPARKAASGSMSKRGRKRAAASPLPRRGR